MRQCGSRSQTVLLVRSGGTLFEGCFADPGTGRLKGDRGPWAGLARRPEGGQRARSTRLTAATGPVTRCRDLFDLHGFLAIQCGGRCPKCRRGDRREWYVSVLRWMQLHILADRPLRKIVHADPFLLGVLDEAIVLLDVEHSCDSPRSRHGLEGLLHRMTLLVN